MYKKILLSVILCLAMVFTFSLCFAADNNLGQDLLDGTRNVVGGAENALAGAANSVSNAAKDATGAMENGANSMMNGVQNAAENMVDNNNYNATRTSVTTSDTTFMGMGATAWTWLIMGIAAIAIIALVWYYSSQLTNSRNDD